MASASTNSIPTLYDETFRARNPNDFCLATVGNRPNLIGFLEHHSEETDGSFAICIAGGIGALVSQELWESIPEAHRPALDTRTKGWPVPNEIFGTEVTAIGSVMFPFLLTNMTTKQRFRLKLYALVIPKLNMGMFISQDAEFCYETIRGGGKTTFRFKFNDELVKVEGR